MSFEPTFDLLFDFCSRCLGKRVVAPESGLEWCVCVRPRVQLELVDRDIKPEN